MDFEKGPMFLKTMTLKKIAEMVNVHESTVSRAINGKYVQTPGDIRNQILLQKQCR